MSRKRNHIANRNTMRNCEEVDNQIKSNHLFMIKNNHKMPRFERKHLQTPLKTNIKATQQA